MQRPSVDDILGSGGALARLTPAFEARAGQLALARACARVFQDGGLLLAEAGTGTGKTLAYLAAAVATGRRVAISTATRTLQDQIARKDIPRLEAALGETLVAAVLKGRPNYLCVHRLDAELARESVRGASSELEGVAAWARSTPTGDRADHDGLPEDHPLWERLTTTSETCLGGRCPLYTRCFVTRARAAAEAADLIVVNHHLYFGDAAVRAAGGELLPPHDAVIFDEAHAVAEVAAQFFGRQISTHRLGLLAQDLLAAALEPGAAEPREELHGLCLELATVGEALFSALRAARGPGRGEAGAFGDAEPEAIEAPRMPYGADYADARVVEAQMALDSLLLEVEAQLEAAAGQPTSGEGRAGGAEALGALRLRARALRDDLELLVSARTPGWVFFREIRGAHVHLTGQPIEAAAPMRAHVLDAVPAMVFTSATLTVDGSFEFVRARLGLPDAVESEATGRTVEAAVFESPFDHARQARLYLPDDLPTPDAPNFTEAAEARIRALCDLTSGRAFLLFTSHRALDAMHRRLTARGGAGGRTFPHPILRQGDAPRTALIERFQRTPGAVLLGTATFWEGVDVPGDALSLVVIDKLPFEAPNDPVLQARLAQCRERGGNPFAEVQIPAAALALKQGFGRLLRTATDRGVVAVLDVRLTRKGYGRKLLRSLPPAPVVTQLAEVEAWFRADLS